MNAERRTPECAQPLQRTFGFISDIFDSATACVRRLKDKFRPYVSRSSLTVYKPGHENSAGVRRRTNDRRSPLKRFRYGLDPLCLTASACYACNRWLVPAALKGVFLRGYLSDCLLIPAALPLVLWIQRRLHLRRTDERPTFREVTLHLFIWSLAAEVLAPLMFSRSTADPLDLVAYTTGAVFAWVIWNANEL